MKKFLCWLAVVAVMVSLGGVNAVATESGGNDSSTYSDPTSDRAQEESRPTMKLKHESPFEIEIILREGDRFYQTAWAGGESGVVSRDGLVKPGWYIVNGVRYYTDADPLGEGEYGWKIWFSSKGFDVRAAKGAVVSLHLRSEDGLIVGWLPAKPVSRLVDAARYLAEQSNGQPTWLMLRLNSRLQFARPMAPEPTKKPSEEESQMGPKDAYNDVPPEPKNPAIRPDEFGWGNPNNGVDNHPPAYDVPENVRPGYPGSDGPILPPDNVNR